MGHQNDVSNWIARLHYEPENLVRRFEEEMRGIVEAFLAMEAVPFEKQTSSEVASKLKNIRKWLMKAAEELRYLKIYDGQDLEKCPANMPVHYAIQDAYHERCSRDKKPPEHDYVNSGVDGVEDLLESVNLAIKNTSRPGNSSSRSHEVRLKGILSKNFVSKYTSTFGHFSTTRKDVIEVLEWVFQMAGLSSLNAEGWLRTSLENEKKWLGGNDSEVVKALTKGRGGAK